MGILKTKLRHYIFILAFAAFIPAWHLLSCAITNSYPNNIQVWHFRDGKEQSTILPDFVVSHAKKDFGILSNRFNDTFFNTKLLKNSHIMRSLMTTANKNIPNHMSCGHQEMIKINDSLEIPYTYFNRNSDTLMIVGGGLANDRERMAPFIAIFPTYDIVLFDYRGHGLDQKPTSTKGKISRKLLGIDCTLVTMCEHEDEEVLGIIKHFKKQRTYSHVFGIGLCYSAIIFAKVAAKHPHGSFDKLILDGSWPDLKQLGEQFSKDPKLFYDPQRGGCIGRFLGKIGAAELVFKRCWEWIFSRKFSTGINAIKLFEKLNNIPVLFFHSTNDQLIPMAQFEQVWRAVPHKQKIGIITPCRHLQNFVKYKEIFALTSQLFLENSCQKSIRTLLDKKDFEKEKHNLYYPV